MHGQRSFRDMYWIHIWHDQTLHSLYRILSAHPAVWQGTFCFWPHKGYIGSHMAGYAVPLNAHQATRRVCCCVMLTVTHPPCSEGRRRAVWALAHPDSSVITLKCCRGLSKVWMEARPNGHPHATQGCARAGTLLHLQEPGLRGVTLLLHPQQTLKNTEAAGSNIVRKKKWVCWKRWWRGRNRGGPPLLQEKVGKVCGLHFVRDQLKSPSGWISLPKIYFKHKVCLWLFLSQRCFIILAQLHLVLLVCKAILHTDRL